MKHLKASIRVQIRYLELRKKSLQRGRSPLLGEVLDKQSPEQLTDIDNRSVAPNIVGYARNELGIGEDARMTYESLALLEPATTLFAIQPPGHPTPSPNIAVNWKSSNKLNGIVNIFCLPLVDFASFRAGVDPIELQKSYNVVIAPWEFGEWPRDLDLCTESIDEIWAPSAFVAQAYSRFSGITVKTFPLAVTIPEFQRLPRSNYGIPEDNLVFGFVFDFNSLLARKNPMALVKAFQRAFPNNENVNLVIKTMYRNSHSATWNEFQKSIAGDSRIIVIDQVLPRTETLSLMSCFDCYVSLHRSEGFGRTLAEAMLLKIPVITSLFSGTADFADQQTAFIVEHSLTAVRAKEYPFAEGMIWAEPSIEGAARQMKLVAAGGAGTTQKVQAAFERISSAYGAARVGGLYHQRFLEIIHQLKNKDIK
jgi:glycosyltransferase involved in cell wall biosynthesis